MELQQIERLSFEVAQAAFDERRQILAAIALGCLFAEAASGLGGDVKLFRPLFPEFREQALAAAVTGNIRSIEEIHSGIQGGMKRGERVLVVHGAPRATNGPRAKTDIRNFPARAAQFTIVHSLKLQNSNDAFKWVLPQVMKMKFCDGDIFTMRMIYSFGSLLRKN